MFNKYKTAGIRKNTFEQLHLIFNNNVIKKIKTTGLEFQYSTYNYFYSSLLSMF